LLKKCFYIDAIRGQGSGAGGQGYEKLIFYFIFYRKLKFFPKLLIITLTPKSIAKQYEKM
jgi:hypothetical protein